MEPPTENTDDAHVSENPALAGARPRGLVGLLLWPLQALLLGGVQLFVGLFTGLLRGLVPGADAVGPHPARLHAPRRDDGPTAKPEETMSPEE